MEEKRTVAQRLEEIIGLCNFKLWHLTDKKIDSLYQEMILGAVALTEEQEDTMFYLIDRVANHLYSKTMMEV